ncbi:helix-turn-helix domain-containing protein [Sphingomonas profundi]|uniref:helix-turn-helix domain-containing protein n=1 Tax=Alterirhizorhabdus profundi TaxID=2681549 RepID=UPI0012E7561E|nr:helix-turn-helix transcriptional regulator [Sphingomonas profundi]
MITCLREVRLARGLTLQDVADRCDPPTTAQTIGRLETGTRTVSVAWLNRIAAALGVAAADLVRLPERIDLPVIAIIAPQGLAAPRRPAAVHAPSPAPGQVAILVSASVGEYRAGDEIWCDRLAPPDYGTALARDVVLPRFAGRLLFGRLLGREGGHLHVLPPALGARPLVVADPPWLAVAARLVRSLAPPPM